MSLDTPTPEKVGYDSRFALFHPIPVDASIQNELYVDFRPTAPLRKNQAVDFAIPATHLYYIDMSRTTLCVGFRLMRSSDNSVVKITDHISTINLPIAAFFRQVDVSLNQTHFTLDVNSHYAYRAILDVLSTKSTQFLESVAQSWMFYRDSAGAHDSVTVGSGSTNAGLVSRYKRTSKGKDILMEAPLFMDLSSLKQFIPTGVEIRVRLYQNPDSFCLMTKLPSTETYSFDINYMALRCKFIEPTPSVQLMHAKTLESQPAVYAYERTVLKSWSIPDGLKSWSLDSLYADELPHEIQVVFVDSKSFSGEFNLNPFKFAHFDLVYMAFMIEGMKTITFEPDFDTGNYTHSYLTLFDGIPQDQRSSITYEEFSGGYSVFRICISSGIRRMYNMNTRKSQTRMIIRFRNDLKQNVTCITYAKFHSTFKIDHSKNIYLA